ncbi:hypothetical protein [Magnetospirillum sp. 15-1]|uniref:hypothetical protein n=1 Tax=Magnetospirillum sp. 15-1 TaxID=1979370 RepID=UPI001481F7C3|nr:hypothetical protein [Magnetospirillum sp. 15-1]
MGDKFILYVLMAPDECDSVSMWYPPNAATSGWTLPPKLKSIQHDPAVEFSPVRHRRSALRLTLRHRNSLKELPILQGSDGHHQRLMPVHQPGMGNAINGRPKSRDLPDFPGEVIGFHEVIADLDGGRLSPEYRHYCLTSACRIAGCLDVSKEFPVLGQHVFCHHVVSQEIEQVTQG